jgi:hypothetical protein
VNESSDMSPCYFPASLVGNNQFHRMTVTRIGRDRAQLTGEAPLAVGAQTLLEMNRPTDGARIRVPVRVVRIRDEGRQFGWKPAFHVEFLEELSAIEPQQSFDRVMIPAGPGSPFEPAAASEASADSVESSVAEPSEEIVLLSAPEPPVHASISMDGSAERASIGPSPSADEEPPMAIDSEALLPPLDPALPDDEAARLPRRESAWTPWSGAEVNKPDEVDREDRVLSEIPVTYFGTGGEKSGTAQDFSRQGMFLAVLPTEALPRLGDVMRLSFPVPEADGVCMVGMHGEVRWTHGADDRAAKGKGVGLQIVRFDDEPGERAYQRWVSYLVTQN